MPMNMQYERAFGLDLSKKTFHGCILDGPDLGSHHFFTGEMGPKGKAKLAGRLCRGDLVLMEAGTSSFSLARFLAENTEAEIVVLNPAKLYNIFNSTLKTDKSDSEKIARIARNMPRDEWPTVAIPTKEEQAERSAVSLEIFLAHEITMLGNRLLCEEPLAIEQAIMLSDQIDHVNGQLEQCKQRLREICFAHPLPALSLLSLPGVGLMNAAAQIAFLNDGSRFSFPDSYVNYIGLSERRFDSGMKVTRGHISHMGIKCIRRNIIQASWIACTMAKCNPLSERYDYLRSRGKSKSVAVVAVAKKMIQLSYILVKNNGIYEFSKQQGLEAFKNKLKHHKLAGLLEHLPEFTKSQMEEIDRTKRKETAATASYPKEFA